jgi:drug/metabolite transporter (DMT)-like permease
MMMTPAAWLMLLALSGLWGSSYFLIEIALAGFPVLTLVALRISLAACVLWLFVAVTGARVPGEWRTWRAFLVMGILNNIIPFSLIVWGQTEITSSLAAILNATTPIFAVLMAGLVLEDERVTPARLVAVGLGFGGVVVMVGPDALRALGGAALAQLAVVLAGLSYACASVFGRRFHRLGVAPLVSAACQVTMSSLLLLPVALLDGGLSSVSGATPRAWLAVAALAIFSTALAYVLYFRLLAVAGATNVMLVTFLIPVTAILLGTLVLGERLGAAELLGMALIFLALLTIDGRVFNQRRSG